MRLSEVLPELANYFRGDEITGAGGQNTHGKHAIILQVLECELAHQRLLLRHVHVPELVSALPGLRLPPLARPITPINIQMPLDKAQPVAGHNDAHRPRQKVNEREDGQKAQPEPHEYVDDLVEKVYAQDTLHRPVVRVADLPDLEVAVGDAREVAHLVPLLATQQHLEDLDAKGVVVVANEAVEQKQLTHRIRHPQ